MAFLWLFNWRLTNWDDPPTAGWPAPVPPRCLVGRIGTPETCLAAKACKLGKLGKLSCKVPRLNKETISRWRWFQTFWIFTPTWGNDPILLINIFQMGWNHQLDKQLIFNKSSDFCWGELKYILLINNWFFFFGTVEPPSKQTAPPWKMMGLEDDSRFGPAMFGTTNPSFD